MKDALNALIAWSFASAIPCDKVEQKAPARAKSTIAGFKTPKIFCALTRSASLRSGNALHDACGVVILNSKRLRPAAFRKFLRQMPLVRSGLSRISRPEYGKFPPPGI